MLECSHWKQYGEELCFPVIREDIITYHSLEPRGLPGQKLYSGPDAKRFFKTSGCSMEELSNG